MSQPVTSLPFELRELMTNTTIDWLQGLDTDINGQWSYASPVQIDCWVEGEGYGSDTGITDSRANFNQNILQQTRRPEFDLFFDGDDADVRSFKVTDLFDLSAIPGCSGVQLMATVIETIWGVGSYDTVNPWCLKVGF